jgi:uncharacterized protein YjbI with pentapeptide repeats
VIVPQRAAVRPRVRSAGSGEPLLLEDAVCELIERGRRGIIAVLGAAGAGKTTALHYLAYKLPLDVHIRFFDEPSLAEVIDAPPNHYVIYAAEKVLPTIAHRAVFHLTGWDRDDLVEYLLAVHPQQCAALMSRLSTKDNALFHGIPELWRLVLDRLAADPTLPNARAAFHRRLEEWLADSDLIERARSVCLNAVCTDGSSPSELGKLARRGVAAEWIRILRHPPAQQMLAAERVAADLHAACDCDFLAHRLPRDLVQAAAELIREDSAALDHLRRLLAGPGWSHAMSASLLHAAGIGWMPTGEKPPVLAGAYLVEADWPRVNLAGADLKEACLNSANLSAAFLRQAAAIGTGLVQAVLTDADLCGIQAINASLDGATLRGVKADRANFNGASLVAARIEQANLHAASFGDARLNRVVFEESNLSLADFTGAQIERAVFCEVDLSEAVLSGLCLSESSWHDVRLFGRAQLDKCNLEGLSLPFADFSGANLQGALLTATVMPRASFRNANLRETGLADIEWEGADLRGADLTGATFHMGSTRSGLVGSTIACEGSRTGFYTDEYEEQRFKAPEEIRKANLRDADLRGACITGVDFYLVDLRGARLDPEQEEHVRRCKAILVS